MSWFAANWRFAENLVMVLTDGRYFQTETLPRALNLEMFDRKRISETKSLRFMHLSLGWKADNTNYFAFWLADDTVTILWQHCETFLGCGTGDYICLDPGNLVYGDNMLDGSKCGDNLAIWQYAGTFSLEVYNIGHCDDMCLVTTCWMGVGVVTIWRMDG